MAFTMSNTLEIYSTYNRYYNVYVNYQICVFNITKISTSFGRKMKYAEFVSNQFKFGYRHSEYIGVVGYQIFGPPNWLNIKYFLLIKYSLNLIRCP